jgi:hypothetical protein
MLAIAHTDVKPYQHLLTFYNEKQAPVSWRKMEMHQQIYAKADSCTFPLVNAWK